MLGRAGLVKRVRQRFTSMQDLCEFMVDTGNKMFKGTEWGGKWFIYHDPLKQFFEVRLQQSVIWHTTTTNTRVAF